MTTPADFVRDLAHLGSLTAGGDGTNPLYGIPADLDGQQRLLARCVADLSGADVDEFLEEYTRPGGWSVLVLVSTRHPHLGDLLTWAEAHEDVLFLAADRGPTPPAALVIERGPDREQ